MLFNPNSFNSAVFNTGLGGGTGDDANNRDGGFLVNLGSFMMRGLVLCALVAGRSEYPTL